MYPKSFEYARAESVEHAIALLREYGEEARLLAGGASLIPMMKLRLATPSHVVDIGRLDDLRGLSRSNGAFLIGSLTRHHELERNAELRAMLPIVHDAASQIGDAQVRNVGTIGGSLAECDPAGDWAPVLLALGGEVRVQSGSGARTIAATELFVDAYTTSLAPDELITEVKLPVPAARFGAAHLKIERRAGDYAIASCSVALDLDESGTCRSVGIGLGAVGLVPLRVLAAERLLTGRLPDEPLLREAAEIVATCTESFSDARGAEDYRRHLGGVTFRRAFELAHRRASAGQVERSGAS
jgi:carbon-monoxide dehydrogenase medium subunit